MMEITIHSNRRGKHTVIMDDEDYARLSLYKFYVWTTARHTGIYVNCYSPEDKANSLRLHRVIMGAGKGDIVDHINGNPLDNRRSNLRIVDSAANNHNAKKRRNAKDSVHKGVCLTVSGRWKAQIQIKKQKRGLGTYATEDEAAMAYNLALDKAGILAPRNVIKLK